MQQVISASALLAVFAFHVISGDGATAFAPVTKLDPQSDMEAAWVGMARGTAILRRETGLPALTGSRDATAKLTAAAVGSQHRRPMRTPKTEEKLKQWLALLAVDGAKQTGKASAKGPIFGPDRYTWPSAAATNGGPFENISLCDVVDGSIRCPRRNDRPVGDEMVTLRPSEPLGTSDFAMSVDIMANETILVNSGVGFQFNGGEFIGFSGQNGTWFLQGGSFGAAPLSIANWAPPNPGQWHKLLFLRKSGMLSIFLNNISAEDVADFSGANVESVQLRTGDIGEVSVKNFCFECWFFEDIKPSWKPAPTPSPQDAEEIAARARVDEAFQKLIDAEKQLCFDRHPESCPQWQANGECTSNAEWMTAYCAKSCGACQALQAWKEKKFPPSSSTQSAR